MTRVETLLDSELEPRIKQLTSYGSFRVVTLEAKTWSHKTSVVMTIARRMSPRHSRAQSGRGSSGPANSRGCSWSRMSPESR